MTQHTATFCAHFIPGSEDMTIPAKCRTFGVKKLRIEVVNVCTVGSPSGRRTRVSERFT